MEYEETQHEASLPIHCLNALDCLSITALLSAAFTPCEQRAFLENHFDDEWKENLMDDAWVLLSLHRICHQPNEISARVVRALDDRYADMLNFVRNATPQHLNERIGIALEEPDRCAPLLWALLRSSEPDHQRTAHHMVHAWVGRLTAQAKQCESMYLESMQAALPREDHESVHALKKRIAEQNETLDRMLDYIQRTRPSSISDPFLIAIAAAAS